MIYRLDITTYNNAKIHIVPKSANVHIQKTGNDWSADHTLIAEHKFSIQIIDEDGRTNCILWAHQTGEQMRLDL